jgi:hypothetical protein
MGCSRAQVENIGVARPRAPLYRLEDFAKAVDIRMVIQLIARGNKSVTVRTTDQMSDLPQHITNVDDVDHDLLFELAALLPHLPQGVMGTLRGIIALWTERYTAQNGPSAGTA